MDEDDESEQPPARVRNIVELARIAGVSASTVSRALAGNPLIKANTRERIQALAEKHMAPSEYRVTPHLPFPIHQVEAAHKPQVPPLIKGYLRSGAWICGEPAWDPDFESADMFMMMPLANLDERYARHYGVVPG